MEQKDKTFGRRSRVSGRERVGHLFAEGRGFMAFPFRVSYLLCEREEQGVALLVSIPKRRLRRAVDRNRMKRLAREAYRLNKGDFDTSLLPEGYGLDIALVYVKDALGDYTEVEKGVRKALRLLNGRVEDTNKIEDKG